MTVKQINDAESMARQRLLLEFCEQRADFYEGGAHLALSQGKAAEANYAQGLVTRYRLIAARARDVLMRASGLSLDDAEQLAEINALTHQINDEPPIPLVDLTAWLKGKVGRWFPFVPSTAWQAIAFVLAAHRRQP